MIWDPWGTNSLSGYELQCVFVVHFTHVWLFFLDVSCDILQSCPTTLLYFSSKQLSITNVNQICNKSNFENLRNFLLLGFVPLRYSRSKFETHERCDTLNNVHSVQTASDHNRAFGWPLLAEKKAASRQPTFFFDSKFRMHINEIPMYACEIFPK